MGKMESDIHFLGHSFFNGAGFTFFLQLTKKCSHFIRTVYKVSTGFYRIMKLCFTPQKL